MLILSIKKLRMFSGAVTTRLDCMCPARSPARRPGSMRSGRTVEGRSLPYYGVQMTYGVTVMVRPLPKLLLAT